MCISTQAEDKPTHAIWPWWLLASQECFISSASFQHLHAAFQNPQIHWAFSEELFLDDLTNYKKEKEFKRELKTFEAFDRGPDL